MRRARSVEKRIAPAVVPGPMRELPRDRRPLLHRSTHQRRPGARGRVLRRRPRLPAHLGRRGLLRQPARPGHRRPPAQGRAARRRHRRRPARPRLRVRADQLRAGRPRAHEHHLGRRRQRPGPRADRRQRGPDRCRRPGPGQRPGRRSGRRPLRPALVEPTHPDRQGRATRPAAALAAQTRPGRCRLVGRRPAPRRRLAATLAHRAELAGRAVRQPKGFRVLRVTR